MISNYVKIAWRTMLRNKLYTSLNVIGLAIGILSASLIYLYVSHELSYERFHKDSDHLFRIDIQAKLGEKEINSAQVPAPAGPYYLSQRSEILDACRFKSNGRSIIQIGEKAFTEPISIFADSSVFTFFNFPLIAGDPVTALAEPNTAVISETLANKYFGSNPAMDKMFKLDNDKLYRISGIMKDLPSNTTIQSNLFLSMASDEDSKLPNWGSMNYSTFIRTRPGTDVSALQSSITDLFIKNFGEVLRKYLNTTWEDFVLKGNYARLSLMPLKNIHLYSEADDELSPGGNIRYIYIFSIVGLLILALACINFINLTTARAAKRAKEVGIRKVSGAKTSSLISHFMGDGLLSSALAWILALVTTILLLPFFNQLAGKSFGISDLISPLYLTITILIAALTGFLSGIYPAYFISTFNPIQALKEKRMMSQGKSLLRNGLVVFQFFITAVLLMSSLIIKNQLHFIQHKKLGFEKDQVLVVQDAYLLKNNADVFKQKLLGLPSIMNVSFSNQSPINLDNNNTSIINVRVPSTENTILADNFFVDEDYIKTLGLKLVAGRELSRGNVSDSSAVVINQTLARQMGYDYTKNELREIMLPGDEVDFKVYTVVAVVEDYHTGSLHKKINPIVLFPRPYKNYTNIRFKTDNVKGMVTSVQEIWQALAPGQPFSYTFLDDRFAGFYIADQRVSKIISVFTGITVLIACIGLFGLITFIAEQKVKEIGIRKVLGAGVFSVTQMLSLTFIKLIVLAVVPAIPIAYLLMNKWLKSFEYRTAVQVWIFFAVIFLLLFISVITIGGQAIRAAMANPVKSLRTE